MQRDVGWGASRFALGLALVVLAATSSAAQWVEAPPGPVAGFQGFGLGYHLGYGYGGHGLGVGPFGGYPRYGGPGYPCPDPRVMYRPVGPLTPNPSVVIEGNNRFGRDDVMWYGQYTGAIPYPETLFAPYSGERRRPGANRRPPREGTETRNRESPTDKD